MELGENILVHSQQRNNNNNYNYKNATDFYLQEAIFLRAMTLFTKRAFSHEDGASMWV